MNRAEQLEEYINSLMDETDGWVGTDCLDYDSQGKHIVCCLHNSDEDRCKNLAKTLWVQFPEDNIVIVHGRCSEHPMVAEQGEQLVPIETEDQDQDIHDPEVIHRKLRSQITLNSLTDNS